MESVVAQIDWITASAAWAAVVVSIVYSVLTWTLVLETRRMRLDQGGPALKTTYERPYISGQDVYLVISNSGESPVHDVQITPSVATARWLTNDAKIHAGSQPQLVFSTIQPRQSLVIARFVAGGEADASRLVKFEAACAFRTSSRNQSECVLCVDPKAPEYWYRFDPMHEQCNRIVRALEEIGRSLKAQEGVIRQIQSRIR